MEKLTYRTYPDPALAQNVYDLLVNEGLPAELNQVLPSGDTNLGGAAQNNHWVVRLPEAHFGAAHEILANQESATELLEDHFLNSYTVEELQEVVIKADEWDDGVVRVAKQMLKQIGQEIPEAEYQQQKAQRMQELAEPDQASLGFLIGSYVMAFAGGWIALFIGWNMATGKKSLPNGTKVYSYRAPDRKHGWYIFGIGILAALATILLVFLD